MATTNFDTLIYKIAPIAQGCPQPTIIQHLRDAAIKTCERTLAWRYEVPAFNLTADTADYSYSTPAGSQVHVVFEALVNDNHLAKLTLEQALSLYPDNDTTSEPRAVCQLSADKFRVLPTPDDADTYEMRLYLALKPTRSADGMDSVVLDDLEDVIVHGALQSLLLIPNSHWTDLELASYHARQYLAGTTERRARANLGNFRATMTARMQKFGA